MQGWFAHSTHFIPNNETLPIFVGTHFSQEIYKFLGYFNAYYPWFFENKTIGCRDLSTLEFCKSLGLKAYLSRCLTLTLPRRNQSIVGNTIYLVGVPKEMLPYLPKHLREDAQKVEQQNIKCENSLDWKNIYTQSESLLEVYKTQAKLVITCALHCAAPCLAMGIPVVLIAKDKESLDRFSAVKGILPIWTFEDLKAGCVNFSPTSLDIESLKKDMLENLKFSMQKEMGEKIDEENLCAIRERIANFKVSKTSDSMSFVDESAGGGAFRETSINTWKSSFNYDVEFKQRSQILLDLLSQEEKKNLRSVLDLGCGIQYFKDVLRENGLAPIYCGVDLYPHKEDNILCDFNKGEFPNFSKQGFDLIVCAGLFEYIVDLQGLVNKICALSPNHILCSYNFDGISLQNSIWVNRLDQKSLFNLFFLNDYYLNDYKTHRRNNPTGYFLFCKKEKMGR